MKVLLNMKVRLFLHTTKLIIVVRLLGPHIAVLSNKVNPPWRSGKAGVLSIVERKRIYSY